MGAKLAANCGQFLNSARSLTGIYNTNDTQLFFCFFSDKTQQVLVALSLSYLKPCSSLLIHCFQF